MMWWCQKK